MVQAAAPTQTTPETGVPVEAPSEREGAIEVRSVSKCYQIYARPADRLKQAITRWKKKYYREFWALRDVSFTVAHGETVGIIGRNGSGKSTLLQMIAGTLTPTEGSISARGKISALLELGAGFNPEFTGRENVFLAGSIRGLSRARVNELFDDIADFADIGEFIDQPVKTYSSGMYVRLAFAVAAQVRPEILVVDEALAVGDVFFQQRCHAYMREQLAETTKLLVTHDLNAVATHCDRAIVLDKGRKAFEGKPLDAIAFYTRIVHNERFGAGRDDGQMRGANSGSAEASLDASVPWIEVSPEKTGGAGDVRILRVAMTDANGEPVKTIQPEDAYTCHYEIRVEGPRKNLIFGVVINDRFGKAVCGDNTLSLRHGHIDLPEAGRYTVALDYRWPELRAGEYTATFGIGEGEHSHHHTVQCWAHNIVSIAAITPRRPVHGLFTNPLRDVKVSRLG